MFNLWNRRRMLIALGRGGLLALGGPLAFGAGGRRPLFRSAEPPPQIGAPQGRVYIVLWFDTEDYILPQSDDAGKRIAAFLTQQGIRATFKVVGEKARTLERRGRRDVIGALAQHEIGYHANTHSQHPTPAEYEAPLDWEGGVDEFDRREHAGFEDVRRILGQTPTCYGQPGSSWAPQAFGALHKWGVKVYLDDGQQVGLDGEPFWFGGLLNLFNLRDGATLRPNDDWSNLADAKGSFQDIYVRLTSRPGGGIISLYFHPCEFVHQEFWDAVNFANGANPPASDWRLPPVKSPEASDKAFQYLQEIVTYMKSFPRVQFVTASDALTLYRDTAQRRVFSNDDLAAIASQVVPEVTFQGRGDYALSASEVLFLLNTYLAHVVRRAPQEPVMLDGTPYGPAESAPALTEKLDVPWAQFARTVTDVQDFLEKNNQVPSEVWFGSRAASPESYLVAVAQTCGHILQNAEHPETVTLAPAELAAAKYVADDSPKLWSWVIFPHGFDAPHLMVLAKRQAWTLKPANLHSS